MVMLSNNIIDNQNVPENYVKITTLLKLHQKDIRKMMMSIIHKNFNDNQAEENLQLLDIIEYAIFLENRYYRSFFISLFSEIFNIPIKRCLFLGAIIELLYCHHMMRKNLPELDNNDLYERQETCHKKFGKPKTILASDLLFNIIVEIITNSEITTLSKDKRCDILNIITKHNGKNGLCGGQMMKLNIKKQRNNNAYLDEIARIHTLELVSLFRAGLDIIYIIHNCDKKTKSQLNTYINNLCNILEILNNITTKNAEYSNIVSKLDLFAIQAENCIKTSQYNTQDLVDFVKYNKYLIELYIKDNNIYPIIVQSDVKEANL